MECFTALIALFVAAGFADVNVSRSSKTVVYRDRGGNPFDTSSDQDNGSGSRSAENNTKVATKNTEDFWSQYKWYITLGIVGLVVVLGLVFFVSMNKSS